MNELDKAFVEVAKALGAEAFSLTTTGKCKACGETISPLDELCMVCRGENIDDGADYSEPMGNNPEDDNEAY